MTLQHEVKQDLFGLFDLGIDWAPAVKSEMSLHIPLVSFSLNFTVLSFEFDVKSDLELKG